MQVNTRKLCEKIAEAGLTRQGVAKQLGVNASTFYRKLKKGGCGITVGEMHQLIKMLKLSREETLEIFCWQGDAVTTAADD